MFVIESRNVDGKRLTHHFTNRESFLEDAASDDPKIGDNEILAVWDDDALLYSSLGRKADSYEDTLRTQDLVDWLT